LDITSPALVNAHIGKGLSGNFKHLRVLYFGSALRNSCCYRMWPTQDVLGRLRRSLTEYDFIFSF